MYSNISKPESPAILIEHHTPRVTSYLNIITEQRYIQTDKLKNKSQAVQATVKQ